MFKIQYLIFVYFFYISIDLKTSNYIKIVLYKIHNNIMQNQLIMIKKIFLIESIKHYFTSF